MTPLLPSPLAGERSGFASGEACAYTTCCLFALFLIATYANSLAFVTAG